MAMAEMLSAELIEKIRYAVGRNRLRSSLRGWYAYVYKAYVLLAVVEAFVFPSFEVLWGLLVSWLGILVTGKYICRSDNFMHYPVSSIALLFYCLFFEVMPLPATLLEGKPIIFNLRNPYVTFAYLLALQAVLVGIHRFYVRITARRNVLREFLSEYHFFSAVTSGELWFLVGVSVLWYVYKMFAFGLYTEEQLNTNTQFNVVEWAMDVVFSGYCQVIFLFYFRKFHILKGRYAIHHWAIALITVVLFFIGIGTNMRTAAVAPLASGAFMMAVYMVYYPRERRRFMQPAYVATMLLLAAFAMGPFQYISRAMIASRADRGGKNASEMIERTLAVQDEDIAYVSTRHEGAEEYSEQYLESDLLNRFCSLKILDETLYRARTLNDADRQVMRYTLLRQLLDQLPGVVKQSLDIKNQSRYYSLTDMLYALSYAGYAHLGGIKIGTLPGLGYAMWGNWFFLVLVPIYLCIFYMLDSLAICQGGRVRFSLLFFVGIMNYVYYFSDRHYYLYDIRFIFRTYWESVVFFLIAINLVKKLPFLRH